MSATMGVGVKWQLLRATRPPAPFRSCPLSHRCLKARTAKPTQDQRTMSGHLVTATDSLQEVLENNRYWCLEIAVACAVNSSPQVLYDTCCTQEVVGRAKGQQPRVFQQTGKRPDATVALDRMLRQPCTGMECILLLYMHWLRVFSLMCSIFDRAQANQLMGLGPGEVFVQRNVGNLVTHKDMNAMSCLEYAVTALKVRHIIICGHHDCGAIKGALSMSITAGGGHCCLQLTVLLAD